MTTTQDHSSDMDQHQVGDPLQELARLREAHSQLRQELVAVRRQRDEAVSQAQWMIARLTNAEKAIERLQGELLEARAARRSADGADEPTEQVVAEAPETAMSESVNEVQADDQPVGAVADAVVDDDVVADAGAPVEVPQQLPAPGSWAGTSAWLPPDEPNEGSMAHEFAALTERALAVEAAEAEEAEAVATAPMPIYLDVLPEPAEPKKGSLLRRRR